MSGVTPFHSSVGGALLGAASAAKLALTGRVLGISGTLRGLLRGDTEPWRASFLSGLASTALIATYTYPVAFQTLSYSVRRHLRSSVALRGALVWTRGVVWTVGWIWELCRCVFMVAGILTATLTKTADALGVVRGSVVLPSTNFVQSTSIFALLSLVALSLPALLSRFVPSASLRDWVRVRLFVLEAAGKVKRENGVLDCLAEFVCGGVFGSALCLSGITQASKVAAFLSPLHPGFDPSLLCVMGAALLVATPVTHLVLRYKRTQMHAPVCGVKFQVPTNRNIDTKLLTGGLLFGAGWGLGGICPGPALVSLMHPSPKIAVYCAFLCMGFVVDTLFGQRIFATLKPAL